MRGEINVSPILLMGLMLIVGPWLADREIHSPHAAIAFFTLYIIWSLAIIGGLILLGLFVNMAWLSIPMAAIGYMLKDDAHFIAAFAHWQLQAGALYHVVVWGGLVLPWLMSMSLIAVLIWNLWGQEAWDARHWR